MPLPDVIAKSTADRAAVLDDVASRGKLTIEIDQPTIVITDDGADYVYPVGTRLNRVERTVQHAATQFGYRAPIDTGILPPGVLLYRNAGEEEQIVLQIPPGIYPINWAMSEHSEWETYLLAQPWKIAVGTFINGNFLGARMFYSPYQISTLDQPLYHLNTPNVNCNGYNGTGVGWICLYQNDNTRHMDVGAKAHYLYERLSGQEVFNDDNMDETDGTRFYYRELHHKQNTPFLWHRDTWETKSEEEGYVWTLDPDLWIPVLVESAEDQGEHHYGGVPLTLDMVLNGNGWFYYDDENIPRLITQLHKGTASDRDMFYNLFVNSITSPRAIQERSNNPYSR